MASMICVSDYIHILYKKIVELCDAPHEFAVDPFLILDSSYSINGEALEGVIRETKRKFTDCDNYSSVRALIEQNEPLPMDTMVDPEDAEIERDMVADAITLLLHDCDGVKGLKALQVDVIVEINRTEEECVSMDTDNAEVLRERMMRLCPVVERKEGMEDENCAICLDEINVEEVVVCTPCFHRSHVNCLGRWFQENCLCPLCRFKIKPF